MKDMYVQIQEGQVSIYIKARGNEYFQYNLLHCEKDYTDGGTYQNQNVWRLYQLRHYYFADEQFIQGMPFDLVNNGEWECAIKVSGTPDFHGGFHGYEKLEKVCAYIDEVECSIQVSEFTEASKFVFVQESQIYLQGSKDNCIALHKKKYVFTKEGLKLHQNIIWKQSMPVECAYLSMLPIRRTSDDTPNGMQITDTATSNYDNAIYDVSKEGHITTVSPKENRKKNVTHVKIWGEQSKLYAEIKVDCNLTDTNFFFIQNTKQYNKLYFSYVGSCGKYYTKHYTKHKENWIVNTHYSFKLLD